MSIEDAPQMQEVRKLKGFFTMLSALGNVPFVFIFYILSINFMAKPAALYLWCGMGSVYYLCNIMKSVYA